MSAVTLFYPSGDAIAFAPNADERKSQALAVGALVGLVTDDASNAEAVEAMKAIKSLLNEVESTRKKVKEPVLDLARKIDAAAKDFAAELDEEFKRIQRASADYQTAQLERVREQERKRAEEAARIERERQEALRKIEQERLAAEAAARAKAEAEARAAMEEADRIRREAEAKASAEAKAARTEMERKAAQARAEEAARLAAEREAKAKEEAEARAKAEQERIQREAEAKANAEAERGQQELLAVAPAPDKPTAQGQTARAKWVWEVADLWLLVRTSPGLVHITPRSQEINDVIARIAASSTEPPKVPGLRIWEEVKVGVRVGRGKVVDV